MKKLVILSACLWALAGPARAAAGPPEVVVVRIFEGNGGVTAVVTRADGTSEKAQFPSSSSEKGLTQASEGYQKLVALLYQQGYRLQSTFATATQYGTGFITLILTKE